MRTTAELVELAKDGERDAIGELVERYQRVAVATAWTVVGDFHFAQDIAQESFVAAFRRLASCDPANRSPPGCSPAFAAEPTGI